MCGRNEMKTKKELENDYTSLMGADKKKVLERPPEKLPNILHPETASTVQKL